MNHTEKKKEILKQKPFYSLTVVGKYNHTEKKTDELIENCQVWIILALI